MVHHRKSATESVEDFEMKKMLLAAASLISLASCADAADLAARPYTKAPAMIAAVHDWSGFYVGASAGYGWADVDHYSLNTAGSFWTNGPAGAFGGLQSVHPSGAVYGGQVGYNWQSANWVFGIEAAGFGTDLRRTDISIFAPATDLLSARIEGLFTATGRIGYAIDRWLPYIKGGYAGAQVRTINREPPPAFALDVSLDHGEWRSGFLVGGGLEYAITNNWIAGVEYNYMDFGSSTWSQLNRTAAGAVFNAAAPENYRDHVTMQTVTARLSYKFGGPIVAKY
ncbi:outer membrane protein [Bradyrhizobium amphicarpaeae]|uniref:Porin family protein n=1 Tax=Bradyrhizobium amphicarpaeae TaxID=1404768 RepID=A0A2U8PVI9_9BRAD|nr:outer membrane protein [Bradyrhizobium amphicarpaeae]AWM01722.1 porin family protein [Bradyrhizobium amphicarpaeae]